LADEVFSLVYDGDATEDGEMSAAELGPALIAISELFTTANDLFNGTETTVATNVNVEPTATVADGTLSVTELAGVVEALPLPQPATIRLSAKRNPIFKVHRFIPCLHQYNLLD